ncbi:PREDICTED: RWD domain-containing protein 2A [Papilio polytes]|uniref:RWD domain-containing protein 2A n=1 Tax=Papilio polytes TaxID=76194 RepID=UPI000675F86B|nr:PREDICTED: RWD domain-containing protein 2A [Papilio polytes]
MESDQSVKDMLIINLNKQLSELELLKSMYPNQNEIIITDNSVLEDIKHFVENESFNVPNHLDFILKIHLNGFKLEIYVNLPTLYPEEEPDVYVRCNQLDRQQETNLNSELSTYIKISHENEVCLYTAISWLQENIENFKMIAQNVPKPTQTVLNNKDITFVRLWIFSHHIYSKYKREQIIDKCKELNLTGFCLPGKPGIICIEGIDKDCSEWWREIKALNWKKISIRKSEVFDIKEKEKQQQFKDFQEVSFQTHLSNSKTAFSKFLEEHNLSQEFGEFLGI